MLEFCAILPSDISCQTYWTGVLILVGVCFLYNRLIDWLFDEGWGSLTVLLQVAGDLIVTFFFGLVYSWEAAAVLLSLFVFAGLVMIWGAFRRNQKRKEDDRKATMEAARLTINGGKDD